MTLTCDPQVAAANAARRAETQQLKLAEIDSDWLDNMVKRLFSELDRQMKQVEDSKPDSRDANGRAANARTLASLERTLEKLARTERERAAMRHSKALAKDGNAKSALDRAITRIVTIELSRKDSGEPE
ncbi:MAG TPA: hypothetical protein VHW02_09965 [Rhizomicrobium sp.]|jgi:hypothetical protein|nr:hypothetical protein [Rhizomicrobium sp.]